VIPRSRSLAAWARTVGINYKAALRFAHRAVDPLPTLFLSGRHHVDVEAAEKWLHAEARRQSGKVDLDKIVNEVVAAVRGDRS